MQNKLVKCDKCDSPFEMYEVIYQLNYGKLIPSRYNKNEIVINIDVDTPEVGNYCSKCIKKFVRKD